MLIATACLLLLPATEIFAAGNGGIQEIPVPGKVTLAELGSTRCIPCKLMMPIMEELKQEYNGRLAVVFVDIMEHPGTGQKFNIMSIPTQIFFDADGKEVLRHVGFMEKAAIVAELEKLGLK
ncbi:thioredoxin [Desulfoprunum benzoelyticum]|nr:thioredoxin domain-containing protein [Desulfoprunum benzoelyticum]MBM9529087.1 thioredoxin [Desulfoprunum benzoelyticum]